MSEKNQKEDGSVEVELKEENEVVVEVEKPEQPPVKETAPQSEDEELAQYSDTVKRRIDKLTYKAREAERQRDAAVEYAKSLKQQAETADTRSSEFAKSLTVEYETRVQAQEQLVNDRLRRAIDRGDIDDQILAQRALAELAVEKERLRGNVFRPPVEREIQQPVYAPQAVQPTAPRPDPKAEQWAEKNMWFGADQPMTLTAFSHHRDMVEKEGFDPQSDDYYDELDKRMRRDFPHKFQQQQAQRSVPTQAVASGRLPARADNVQKIKLKPSEVAIAKRLGVKLEDYARQVKKLQGGVQ